jgi:Asp/Glu/hydantoin racemase
MWIDPKVRSLVIDKFLEVSHMLVEDGAEVIIPGGGVVHLLLALEKIEELEPGVPTVDGMTVSVKMTEALCRLKSLGKYSVSRSLTFQKPTQEYLDAIAKHLGLA